MIRENLETKSITSYLYFGNYKFRVRYAGQQPSVAIALRKIIWNATAKKRKNMIILTKNSKMERRLAKNPPGSISEIEPLEPLPTLERAKQSFEDNKRNSSTPNENKIKRKSITNHTKRQCKQRLWEAPFV